MPPDHAAPDDEPVAQPVPGPQRPSRRALADTEPSGRRGAGRRRKGASTQETLAPLLAIVPGLRLMVGMVIAAVVILGLYVGRDVLLPVALAALLGFLLDPAVSRLKRWGLPRVVSVALVMVLALGALGAGALYVGNQVTSLSAELPTYQNTIRQKLRHVKPYFNGPGVWDGAVKVLNTVETEIGQGDARRRVQKVEVQEPEVKPIQKALELLSKVAEPLATTGIVFLFVVLILLDRSGLQDRLLRLMGPNTHMASDALDDAATRIGQYLRMQLFVNLSYGVPMALGLWWIGVPGAILWGILAAVLRFVPYIGPMASAVFPLWMVLPKGEAGTRPDVRRELKVLTRPEVLLAMGTTVLGAGSMFTLYTYVAPVLTEITHASPGFIAFALVLIGVGFTIGNSLGGRLADWSLDGATRIILLALALIMVVLPWALGTHLGAGMGLVVWGAAAFGMVPPVQMRVMQAAAEAPGLASSVNVGAFNLGNAVGAALGGAVISQGLGYGAVAWAGAALAAGGLGLVLIQGRMRRGQAGHAAAAGNL